MDKCSVYLCLIVTVFVTVNCVSAKETCDGSCVKAESCQFFGNLQKQDQSSWLERFDCRGQTGQGSEHVYGFSQSAIGDLVCCPENVWQVDNSQSNPQTNDKKQAGPEPNMPAIEKNSYGYQPGHARANYNYDYPGYGGNQYGNQYENRYGNDDYGPGSSTDDETTMLENTRLWQNRRRERNRPPNPYFMPANNNNGGYDNRGSSYRAPSPGPQCVITSYPPDPNTGCCGREANEEDRIAASQYPNNPRNSWTRDPWMAYSDSEDSASRRKRASGGDSDPPVNVQVGNRIAGGKETELEQFPWTVLLKTTFIYPDKESSFSCGGSLISSRYVLTAGHCVYDQKGSIKQLEVYLAEYDKRTFPKDCKNVLGKGQQCVENIIILAESVNIHPQYDDSYLHNDIALIRLRENAPYTDYIRPICLPPINVDTPDLSQLRLAVAGWGRNGQNRSNIKQSTVVNLVPNDQCAIYYSGLTKQQLCAAGYSGEDTCKGDSGGPLMMVYGGKYYISGVVSGKRADAPCGTSVPSLYTNVYMYLPWIRSVISN